MENLFAHKKPPLLRARPLRRACVCTLVCALATLLPMGTSLAEPNMIGDQLIATSPYHTCALTKATDAGVKCWGANNVGQLGDGTGVGKTSPAEVVGLSSGVASIGAGEQFSCALLTNGEVKCWGSNDSGQIGNDTVGASTQVPTSVLEGPGGAPLSGVVTLSVGRAHVCVVVNSGGAKCWGNNNSGQLGTGGYGLTIYPVNVSGHTSNVTSISAGDDHSCLVTTAHEIFCFGKGTSGQLGQGAFTGSALPVQVSGVSGATGVTAGGNHSCARLDPSEAICWGANSEGTLGDGTNIGTASPVGVNVIGANTLGISAGLNHTCARTASDGRVYCWGRGQEGQIGDNTSTQRTSATSTDPSLLGALDISAGGTHSCAWMGTCTAKCWGDNTNGQLGDGSLVSSAAPVSVTVCTSLEPTPTPTPTATPTATSTPTPLPDACASEAACVPDDRLASPLDPKPPAVAVAASTSKKAVAIKIGDVKLGVPTDLAKRDALRAKLAKFLKRPITNLAAAIKSLQISFVVSVSKAPAIAAQSFEIQALPNKYRVETRKRRVTTRLSAGTYVAKVTVRLRDAKGRTFVTGSRAGEARFTVR